LDAIFIKKSGNEKKWDSSRNWSGGKAEIYFFTA